MCDSFNKFLRTLTHARTHAWSLFYDRHLCVQTVTCGGSLSPSDKSPICYLASPPGISRAPPRIIRSFLCQSLAAMHSRRSPIVSFMQTSANYPLILAYGSTEMNGILTLRKNPFPRAIIVYCHSHVIYMI